MNGNANANARTSFLFMQEDSQQDDGHSSDLDQKRSGILSVKIVHKVNGTKWLSSMMFNIREKADTQSSVPRVHCPEERSKVKVVENCRYTICADQETIETVFRTIISVNQLSIHGAVSDLCEEYRILPSYERGDPCWQNNLTHCSEPSKFVDDNTYNLRPDDPAQEDLLQKYQERVDKALTQQNRVIKFCTDAGFLTTVEVRQYFMAKAH